MSEITKDMYKRVAKIAIDRELPIYKVEQLADLPNGIIGKWRTGRGANINTIVKLAKALDVSVDYLVGITDEQ